MTLSTIGSIAMHLDNTLSLPAAVSGTMVEIVDLSRQYVADYAGVTIGSNNIDAKYQPAIVDFAKADAIDLKQVESGGEKLKLEDLSVDDSGDSLSAKQYRLMGEMKLRRIGKAFNFAKSMC